MMTRQNRAIYLDYAAATPLIPEAAAAMEPYYSTYFYNPSASYKRAINVKKAIDLAKGQIANQIGCRANELVFTAGATEANNLAIKGIMDNFSQASLLISQVEHDSVRLAAKNYKHELVQVDKSGRIVIDDLKQKIKADTVLISIMLANNEVGTIQPLREIAVLINKIRQQRKNESNSLPLFLHSDVVAAANYLDLHISRLGLDLMTINGSKIYGPKQTAILYIKTPITLKPLIVGGGQEFNLRSGTENVAGIIGFSESFKITQQLRRSESKRLEEIRRYLITQLQQLTIAVVINQSVKNHLPNIINVTFSGLDNERLVMELDEAGIMVSAGSACSANHQKVSSDVLLAMGLDDQDARSSIRISMGRFTSKEQIEQTIFALKQITNKYEKNN